VRHAIAESLLPATVALLALVGALVLPAPLAVAGLVPASPTLLAAVALLPIVADTDLEQPAAPEALDRDEIDRIRARQAIGEADLFSRRWGPAYHA